MPATCPDDIWWPLEADNWTSDDAAEPEGDEVDNIEDISRMNGAVPVDDGDETACPGVDVPVFEPDDTIVDVVDDVPEVKAEPEPEPEPEPAADADAGDEEVGPAPAPALASVTATKESTVNSLSSTPSPTTRISRVCCLFSRPLTLKNV